MATPYNTPLPTNSPPFFFNDTATTEIYTLSLHDALPISCTVFSSGSAPVNQAGTDTNSVELGLKFNSDQAGFIKIGRAHNLTPNTRSPPTPPSASKKKLLATPHFPADTRPRWPQLNFIPA